MRRTAQPRPLALRHQTLFSGQFDPNILIILDAHIVDKDPLGLRIALHDCVNHSITHSLPPAPLVNRGVPLPRNPIPLLPAHDPAVSGG